MKCKICNGSGTLEIANDSEYDEGFCDCVNCGGTGVVKKKSLQISSDVVLGNCWRDARKELPEKSGNYIVWIKDGDKEYCHYQYFDGTEFLSFHIMAWIKKPAFA